jgi:hypothetical protein
LGDRRSSTSDLRSGVAESAVEAAADQVAVAVVAEVEGVEDEVMDEEDDDEEEEVEEDDDDSEMRFHQRKLSGGAGDGESTRAEGDGCEVGRYE